MLAMRHAMATVMPCLLIAMRIYARWENERVIIGLVISAAMLTMVIIMLFGVPLLIGRSRHELPRRHVASSGFGALVLRRPKIRPMTDIAAIGDNFIEIVAAKSPYGRRRCLCYARRA